MVSTKCRFALVLLASMMVVLCASPTRFTIATTNATTQRGRQRARTPRSVKAPKVDRSGRRPAKERAASLKQNERRSRSAVTRRAFAAQLRANAARLAAIRRQLALDDAMRSEVQALIEKDNAKGEDMQVRRAAIGALGNHAGTVVVMDPMTGRVYSIVNQEWALHRGFKPCSTIKLVTGLAGLNEGIIDEQPDSVTPVSTNAHINLTKALAYSNNAYFQEVGGRVGFDKMISYARRLGLGEKTGINAPNEFPGKLPAAKSGFAVNHMSSHGDDFMVTPVQLATLVSAMANGGKLLAPRVLRTAQEEAKFKPQVRRQLNIDLDSLRSMVPGMAGSVSYGSGRRAQAPRETVAGKTGTCIENGTWVGLFASYAPLLNPRLAIVVIAQGADAHGHFPATVAGRIYRDLESRFGTTTDLQVASARESGLQTDAKANSQATLNEEDVEEARSNGAELNDSSARGNTNARAGSIQSSTTRTFRGTASKENVLQVLMPIPIRISTNATPSKPQAASETAPPSHQRPRRVTDGTP